ncbi:813_t:CDS:2, partial [Gigaspora margarita]
MRLQHLKAAVRMGSNKVAIDPFTLHNPVFRELIGNVASTTFKSTIIDSEFYNTFVDAEEKFQQLPDDVTRTEFITKIHEAINKLLSEPTKLPLKTASNTTKLKKNQTIQQSNTPLKQNLNITQLSNSKQFEANISKFMNEHFSSYIDVEGDGNCGFRAVAISIGKPEDYWLEIRKLIYKELCIRKSYYIQLFLEKEKEYNKILFTVQWEAGPCGKDHWMSMHSFGYIIANTFQQPVHYFSKYLSLTFLPDNISLNRNTSIIFIYIRERQHFIAAKLKPNVPVPPIVNERIARFGREYEKECKYLQKENLEFN